MREYSHHSRKEWTVCNRIMIISKIESVISPTSSNSIINNYKINKTALGGKKPTSDPPVTTVEM